LSDSPGQAVLAIAAAVRRFFDRSECANRGWSKGLFSTLNGSGSASENRNGSERPT